MKGTMCKIKVTKEVLNIFEPYRPELGKVYDAEYGKPRKEMREFCILDIKDKRIILRKGEFEIVGC